MWITTKRLKTYMSLQQMFHVLPCIYPPAVALEKRISDSLAVSAPACAPPFLSTETELAVGWGKGRMGRLTPQGHLTTKGVILIPALFFVGTVPCSRGSSWPRDGTQDSWGSFIAGRFITTEPLGKTPPVKWHTWNHVYHNYRYLGCYNTARRHIYDVKLSKLKCILAFKEFLKIKPVFDFF